MNPRHRAGSLLSHGWLVMAASLAAIAVLVLLLREPWSGPVVLGKSIRLYAAAGMSKPVNEIIHDYQEKYGVVVQTTFGGTGNLLSTIHATGGAGDLFLSADAELMQQAHKAGLVAEIIPVAVIRPVLIVHAATQKRLQDEGKPVTSLQDLFRDDLDVAFANFKGTAVGRSTQSLLEAEKLWDRLEKRWQGSAARVFTAGTVNEVAQHVALTANSVGIVWDAVAQQFKGLTIVPLPGADKFSSRVEIGVLAKSVKPSAALHFARYLTARDRGLPVFAKYHFEPVPDGDVWEETPQIHVAAGAMLEPGVREVVKSFEAREGVKITTSYAGCGILVSQMKAIKLGQQPGSFPDAYISCDVSFADMVSDWYGSATLILRNRLVLIVPKGNPKGIKSLDDLKRPGLKIGLPHPQNSAIGKLIHDMLVRRNFPETVYDPAVNERVVFTDAAHTLVNDMRAGALDVAIVGRSNALSTPANVEKHLDVIDIDVANALATQTFAIAKESDHKYLMQRLLQAMQANLDLFQRLGFNKIKP